MTSLNLSRSVVLLVLFVVRTCHGDGKGSYQQPIKRSYQVPVTLMNDPQGLQYYAAAPLYTAIPTVFIPNQLGLSAAPIANVAIPPSSEPKPAQEFQETSTSVYPNPQPVRVATHLYKQKPRSPVYVQATKRPTSYINSIYGHPVRMKPLSSIPSSAQKVSSLTIQPSIDLSGQYSQEVASSLYPSTVGPPVGSTYGPAKAIDFHQKTRSGQTVYHRVKAPSHRHPYYPPKKLRVYSHVHKDHVHNHYLPPKHSLSSYKPHSTKYAAPAYLPPVISTPATLVEVRPIPENPPVYSYQPAAHVKFPENVDTSAKEQQEYQKGNNSPGDVTQAIIKNPGVIDNYDANIPIQVPSKKPYQFEVKDILKNSELHFVQENRETNSNNFANVQNNPVLHYTQKIPYQNALLFNQPALYAPIAMDQSAVIAGQNPLDIYNLPAANTYQTNQIVSDQDLGTSESVRVPVAIIRGAHNINGQGGMFGFNMKRQDEINNGAQIKKTFTPSRRTSDWIPMSGNGVPLVTEDNQEQVPLTSADSLAYFSSQQPKSEAPKAVRQPVGDIISGKIPEEFSPRDLTTEKDEDVVSGKIPFPRERRKGSVIDVYPSSNSEVSKMGDTSDLVVSSVIKFS